MSATTNKPWRVLNLRRRPTQDGVAILSVARPSGTVQEIPLFPKDLRSLIIQAATALEPPT